MASYAKRASPAPADPLADDAKDTEPEEPEVEEKEEEEEPQPERKRGRRKKREAEKAAPATPTVERPSRERKTVERYSELTPRAAPAKKSPAILQGSGTKLPNGKGSTNAGSAPTTEEVHAVVSEILKEVDFNMNDEEENHDDADGEMGELEKEYRIHQANHQNILKTLKQHRDDDVSRGQAVKNQKALWDKTLEMRFLLQKAFSTSNKLPKEPIKSRFCNHDKEVEKAYADLLDSSKQTLGCMLDLQEALLERNQAAKGANEMSSDSNGENDEWSEVQKLQRRITPFRNSEIDKWQRKTMVTTGAAALKGKLHAFNQNISDQVTGYMRDPSRMINRMYVRKSTVGVFGEDVGEPGTTREEHNLEGDPELIDDSEFYQQLLKEFLESCDTGASESAFYALRKQQHKKRKLVDRRASKSRKIRYHVHEKIANFMAPVPMVLPPMAPKLFENLFGMGNQKPTTV